MFAPFAILRKHGIVVASGQSPAAIQLDCFAQFILSACKAGEGLQ
jgi:hypothetical protein